MEMRTRDPELAQILRLGAMGELISPQNTHRQKLEAANLLMRYRRHSGEWANGLEKLLTVETCYFMA